MPTMNDSPAIKTCPNPSCAEGAPPRVVDMGPLYRVVCGLCGLCGPHRITADFACSDWNRLFMGPPAKPRDTPGTEHHFLLWFRHNVRLGPAEGDIVERMSRKYFEEFGSLPKGWDCCGECGEPPDACQCPSNCHESGNDG